MEKHAVWHDVVLVGVLAGRSMPGFKHLLSKADSEAIRQYVIKRALDTKPKPAGKKPVKKTEMKK